MHLKAESLERGDLMVVTKQACTSDFLLLGKLVPEADTEVCISVTSV